MCKVSDKSEMVGEIIGWFDMELPIKKFYISWNFQEKYLRMFFCYQLILTISYLLIYVENLQQRWSLFPIWSYTPTVHIICTSGALEHRNWWGIVYLWWGTADLWSGTLTLNSNLFSTSGGASSGFRSVQCSAAQDPTFFGPQIVINYFLISTHINN